MPLAEFHPAVARWFEDSFDRPTPVQLEAWPAIRRGAHTLLAAPTGSGKTLAAFLAAIDELVREGAGFGLPDETRVLYVSPLKALSNDIQKNLQQPLNGIRDVLAMQACLSDVDIRALVRTGDTPQSDRQRMVRTPPHILVTTPESLYILLTSASGRGILGTVRTVIVDEIHALAGNKRGAHLALSLERLQALCPRRLTRVGLSATQKPIERMARFLVGQRDEPCTIVDTGHARERDLALELPGSPIDTIMSNEVFDEIYDRLAALVKAHRTTLVFVNTRRLAERAARHLADRLGEDVVTSHHGSLARKHRLKAEQRLKAGELRVLVATASLELGIDIGDVDLVCQIGSPRSIATFLQRVGRSGHAVGACPKGRLFPLSHDDLVEGVALVDCARRGELDQIAIPDAPLDVLSQQIAAEVAANEWREDALYDTLRQAWPYRRLERRVYDDVVRMLAHGFTTRRGRRGAHVHHDAVNGKLRGRRGARTFAITNGGAIPDQFDYDVMLSPDGFRIGTLGEDFAFESMRGDIFQLGNQSYRILKVEQSKVYVEDAHGQPPNIPFWVGEAPGRSDELSVAVSTLRGDVDTRLERGHDATTGWVRERYCVDASAAQQLVDYLAAGRAALGVMPTQDTIVLERFFDEAGDSHLVIHAPFGSRVNRAWGLALRKRFCRKFNFELQAAALEDSLVLSLGPTHSFPLEEVTGYLKPATVRDLLTQALLDAPMFPAHWRWSASIALALQRNRHGKRIPPQIQRSAAEDLIALVFPDQLACLENIVGKREVPDHPLVDQAIADCLHDTMDVGGLEDLLARLERGDVKVVARDVNLASPFSQAILAARPYAFLDDAPAEERRTRAVDTRRFRDTADAARGGRLDPAAIDRVRDEAWPQATCADELHDALVVLGFVTEAEGLRSRVPDWHAFLGRLIAERRATVLTSPGGVRLWVAAERLAEFHALLPDSLAEPPIDAAGPVPESLDDALREIVRSRLEGLGPVTEGRLAAPLGLEADAIRIPLAALESEGFVLRGRYSAGLDENETEWCERRLLARIHRSTVRRLRREIEPVSQSDYQRFLIDWHGMGEGERPTGPDALMAVIEKLEGFAAPAAAWESEILPARIEDFRPEMLDQLCTAGQLVWLRLGAKPIEGLRRTPVRHTPITLVLRRHARAWRSLTPLPPMESLSLSQPAREVRNALHSEGALFFDDLLDATEMPADEVRAGLAELVAWGLVNADTFAGLRALVSPRGSARRRRRAARAVEQAGRWVLLRDPPEAHDEAMEYMAMALLRRYGVVFRRVLDREAAHPPWRDLLRIYWRLEARGELRGGRFVQGLAGEQFALPEAVGALRDVRRRTGPADPVTIAAADPLNLFGIVLPGERVPAKVGQAVLWHPAASDDAAAAIGAPEPEHDVHRGAEPVLVAGSVPT